MDPQRLVMLVTHVPHAEEQAGNQGDHHQYHGALQVNGIAYMRSFWSCSVVGNKEKGFKCIEGRIEFFQFPAFFKAGLDLIQ